MIEMHHGPGQVVVKSTTLSMVHRDRNGDGKQRETKVEPKSCKETTTKTRKEKPQEGTGERTGKGKTKGEEGDKNTTKQQQRCMFDMAAEGSDAESIEFPKWSEVLHWESQPVCTAELVGQDLAEHELPGRRP